MNFFTDIFHYTFLSNAVLAALLSAVACGIIGSYIVVRRLVFLSGGITHSSFGGIGIAYYLGMNPIVGAAVFAILSALSIEFLSDKGRMREDSTIGILWSVGMAVGIIFVFLTPGYAPNLMSFLFGNILLVTMENIWWLAGFDLLLLGMMAAFYRTIIYTALDRDYAATQGVRVKLVNMMMLTLVALAIVLNIKVVGIVLLVSLLTLPAVAANQLSNNYKTITLLATLFAASITVAGLCINYYIGVPAGATATVIMALLFFVIRLVKKRDKIFNFARK